MHLFKVRGETAQGGGPVVVLCPGCRREGTFRIVQGVHDLRIDVPKSDGRTIEHHLLGSRVCPNEKCQTQVFVIYKSSGLVTSYPAGRIDFDASGVPAEVTTSFEEALTCEANECYIAAAMLIRKTLEQVCEEQQAEGTTLKERIEKLRAKATLPKDLFDAMDHLRLLGNDAAHIEARSYNDVGRDEVQAGIELAKEIIKAVYQYKGLLGKLRALRKPTPAV